MKYEQNQIDDNKRLLCTVPGCGRLWSVQLEGAAPKCSFHQWGKVETPAQDTFAATHKDKGMKAWAYRLKDRHDAGEKLNRNQIESYQAVTK